MPAINVKNISPGLYERLKRSAKEHHRSINSEIITCIEKALGAEGRTAEDILCNAEIIREKTSHYYLNEKNLDAAKKKGRK